MLSTLFDKHAVEAFVDRLKLSQDNLGYANDVRSACHLISEIPEASDCDVRR